MPRMLKNLSIVLASLATFVVASLVALLWFAPGSSADEVARSPSPTGDIEAVLVETNGGVTTSFGYEISLVSRGSKKPGTPIARLYGANLSDSAYGANLRWQSASDLSIEFKQAKLSKLEQPSITVSGHTVRVLLKPGITDSMAPPGGMLYNLRGRK